MSGNRPANERIFQLLRDAGGFVSSQEICRKMGVTRAAIWKHVETLRRRGFGVEGVPALGYRLTGLPDSLRVLAMDPDPASLRLGKTIVFKEETGSTNDDLLGLAREGAEEGTVVVAESQRAGKGRRGRRWESPAGRNLCLSVLLRPRLAPSEAPLLTLLAAVEVSAALERVFGLQPRIKWPNDILLEGRKTAGVLAEIHAEQEVIHHLVLGIGVNLNMTAEMFPRELAYPATSVAIVLGRPVDRVSFTRELLRRLDQGYDELLREGGAGILDRWLRACEHPDAWLEVSTPGGVLRGRFRGLASDGAMILETGGMRETLVHAGDVIRVHRVRPEG